MTAVRDPNERLDVLERFMSQLAEALQGHMNVPFTKAHPRSGSTEEVLQYLGLDLEENAVVVAPIPPDNRTEATAESVL